MKIIRFTIICVLLANSSAAEEIIIAESKVTALESCQEKADASPEQLKEEMLLACLCVVNNVNFDELTKVEHSEKSEMLKELVEQAMNGCKQQNISQLDSDIPKNEHSLEVQ